MVDPISLLASIKTGIAAGKAISSLSKDIGNFFDATDAAKKQLQKKGISNKSVNQTAMDRWATLQAQAESERELQEWISNTYGRSKWLELLKIRREVLQEKREAEALARREAIERQEMMITVVGILVLLLFSVVGAITWMQYLGWVDVRDWLR